MADEGFAAVPTWMFRDESVSGFAIMVYGSLATRSGLRANFPSQETLAKEARCSERKVRDALKELELLGVVTRVRRTSARGHRLSDGYRLMDRPLVEGESLPEPDAAREAYRHLATEPTGTSEQTTPYIEVDSSEVDKSEVAVAPLRADVAALLDCLDEGMVRNGVKLRERSKKNIDAARLLLDADGRSLDEALSLIRWCQSDEFWRGNILSLSKFRVQYDRLRLASQRSAGGRPSVLDVGRAADELLRARAGGRAEVGA